MSWIDRIQFIRKYIHEHIVTKNRSIVKNHDLGKVLNIEDWDSNLASYHS